MIPGQPPQPAQMPGQSPAVGLPTAPGGPSAAGPSQQQPTTIDAVMALLRDGAMRRFRIDIEVDSTITGDESQERQDRAQFIGETTKFVQAWGPIVAANPSMAQLAGELLLFGTRAFRVGRSLEEVIEETVDKLEQQAAQPKPPPPIPPEEQAKIKQAEIKAESEGAKAQSTIQVTGMKAQAEGQKAQIGVQQSQVDAQGKIESQKLDMAAKVMEHQHKTVEHHLRAQEMDRKAIADQHAHNLKIEQMNHAAAQAKKPKDK